MYPSNTIKWNDHEIKLTWIKSKSLESFDPITQIYGVCFDDEERVLICRQAGKDWQLPGGTPRDGEDIEDALAREFFEEVDTKVKNSKLLGVQKVEFPNNPNKDSGDLFYQARYICKLDELLPQTPDPDTGEVWERRFVPASKINDYVHWGVTGAAMFQAAIEMFTRSKPPRKV